MHKHKPFYTVTILALLLLGSCGPRFAHAGMIYQVSVNTSSITGQAGNLDFQFNPGGLGAESAIATITNFQTTGGVLSQPAMLTGDAAGSLPGTLTLDNGTAYNDAFQGFTYGNRFSFLLTLSGPALDIPSGTFGSSFALSLYDAAGTTPLLTTDPNGSILTVNLNANGTTAALTFPQSPTNSIPAAVVTSAVPEPSSLVLCVCALLIVLMYKIYCYNYYCISNIMLFKMPYYVNFFTFSLFFYITLGFAYADHPLCAREGCGQICISKKDAANQWFGQECTLGYECYKEFGKCSYQKQGRCDWSPTPELIDCLKRHDLGVHHEN